MIALLTSFFFFAHTAKTCKPQAACGTAQSCPDATDRHEVQQGVCAHISELHHATIVSEGFPPSRHWRGHIQPPAFLEIDTAVPSANPKRNGPARIPRQDSNAHCQTCLPCTEVLGRKMS